MNIKEKLDLLALSKDFIVTKNAFGYRVDDALSDLIAYIYETPTIEIYIGGAYNTGQDEIEIDIERLDSLREFCGLMIEDWSGD